MTSMRRASERRHGIVARRWRGCVAATAWVILAAATPAWSGTESRGEKAPPPLDSFAQALRFEHGEGVRQDYVLAARLYCDAAAHGDVRAYINLGWMYVNGRGVPRNGGVAVGWWRKAAEKGVPEAANLLRLLASTQPARDLGCGTAAGAVPLAWPARPAPELRATVQRIAQSQGVDAKLVLAVIAAESAFNARAVSPKNAQGLMQLIPETAARFGVRDPFNAEQNIRGGTTYLRWLIERYQGNVNLALAAYNAGEANVDLYGGIPPFHETIEYVERVKRFYAYGEAARP